MADRTTSVVESESSKEKTSEEEYGEMHPADRPLRSSTALPLHPETSNSEKGTSSSLTPETSPDDFATSPVEQEKSRHAAFVPAPRPHAQRRETAERAQKAAHHIPQDQDIEVVDWDSPTDPANPFNWSTSYKWTVTLTVCFISVLTGLPAGAYGAASEQMKQAWDINEDRFPFVSFGLVTWNMGAAVFPLVFVPLTENTGRMWGYFMSYILFLIWLIPSAVAPNFATILVTRFFAGGASSVAINIVGGTITDIWKNDEARSIPMSIFGWTSVLGIALGPFIGGAIQNGLNWRWIYWIQLIVDAGLLPIFWLILRETRGDIILAKKAKKMRKEGRTNAYAKSELERESVGKMLKVSIMRPTKMLVTEFVVVSFTLWVSFAWGILFLFQTGVPIVFSTLYGFDEFQVTLVQLALVVGATLATTVNPLQDRLYLKSRERNTERPGKPIPEARLCFAVPGSVIFGVGMFWLGWSAYSTTHWIVPTLGLGCVGIGVYSIYVAVMNYLADAYEKYAASAISAASLGRNVFGAFLPLAAPALYNNLGFHWASSLVGFIALALSAVPVLLLWKGESIRSKSPFMLDACNEEDEGQERRESLASRGTAGRRRSSVLPWSRVRTVGSGEEDASC